MQVEAIYNQGRIELVQRLRLRHDQVRVIVTVPDEEIESIATPYNVPSEVLQKAAEMRQRMDAARCAPLPPDDEVPGITPKQFERMEAFELRAKMRREQGRPV